MLLWAVSSFVDQACCCSVPILRYETWAKNLGCWSCFKNLNVSNQSSPGKRGKVVAFSARSPPSMVTQSVSCRDVQTTRSLSPENDVGGSHHSHS